MIATAVSTVGFSNDGIGFIVGCLVAGFLRWQKPDSNWNDREIMNTEISVKPVTIHSALEEND